MTTLLTMKGFNKKIDYLCFTANTAGSIVGLTKTGSPTSVNLETSTDGSTWSDYNINAQITLSSVGDKVYFRNKSETQTGFSLGLSDYYYFNMSGSIAASGDCNYLLCKNSTIDLTESGNYCFLGLFKSNASLTTPPKLPATTITSYCYYQMFAGNTKLVDEIPELPATTLGLYSYSQMFYNCTKLSKAPSLPATTLANSCYAGMFYGCAKLVQIPKLPATIAPNSCYYQMFRGCSLIKLRTTTYGEYTQPYRIPTTGTMSSMGNSWNNQMFYATGGNFSGAPSANTTYYVSTSNTIV